MLSLSENTIKENTLLFSVDIENTTLIVKLIGIFNITKYAFLWEVTGYLLITAILSTKYKVLITHKNEISRKIKDIKIYKYDLLIVIIGLILMIVGAIIESYGILTL